MKSPETSSDPGVLYADAYTAHYSSRDLSLALDMYEALIVRFPDATEASYSRMQIHNIVNGTVARDDIFAALIDLARTSMEPSSSNRLVNADPPATELNVVG